MKKILILFLLFYSAVLQAQLIANLQFPASGVIQKTQLWNMVVTNTSSAAISVVVQLNMSDAQSGQQVLNASSAPVTLQPGSTVLNNNILGPIQYNITSSNYTVTADPNGLLPVGSFTVCYDFMQPVESGLTLITENCQDIDVAPLSPPTLVYPYDQTAIELPYPEFNWIPPAPAALFTNLQYDLDLVLVDTLQDPSDAMQQNIPLYHQSNIGTPDLLYPVSGPALLTNQVYAWRITARSNDVAVAQSETWTFTLQNYAPADSLISAEVAFAKLEKNTPGGYALFTDSLKFSYFNELSDSVWNVQLFDVSNATRNPLSFPMDSIPLAGGQNLVQIGISGNAAFVDKHLYQLELVNSRNELWVLKFECLKPNN